MIHTWHIPISGFTQSISRPSGFDQLWLKLRPLAAEQVSIITPQPWDTNFDALAEFIRRMQADDLSPQVNVFAYSWGAGRGFIRLAKSLRKRGLVVRHAVLCDPVYHSWLRPWRALLTGKWSPPIVVPSNVAEVWWFRQFQNRPQATDLLARSGRTIIHPPVVLNADHEWMDDQAEFHNRSLEVAER